MAAPFRPERIATAPFINPYLETLDRVQREPLAPGQLTDRARALLVERCGQSDRSTEAAFAHGAAGLLSGHTHYFNGFAVLMSFRQGTAVALRPTDAPRSQLSFEGSDIRWTFDALRPASEADRRDEPAWVCLVEEVVRQLGTAGAQVEVVVVSTVLAGCTEAYLAALSMAAARAMQALFALPESRSTLIEMIGRIMGECVGLPFSLAYLVTAEAGRPQHFTLVDTATGEQLPLKAPGRDRLGWGLVDIGSERLAKASVHWEYKEKAEKALALLQKRGFDHLTSFRDLDYRDLQRALGALPRRLRPVVRHLVTENHRVQKMVFATRKQDWQLFGALLLMSHASLRDDWRRTSDEVNFVVEQVEAMTLDGMYGASVSGRGGCVLVVGQPFTVPLCLDRVKTAFEDRFARTPATMLL